MQEWTIKISTQKYEKNALAFHTEDTVFIQHEYFLHTNSKQYIV